MILLINPKTSKKPKVQREFFREPNLGLLYLAAILDYNNISVDILDLEQYIDFTELEIKDIVKEKSRNYSVFGITSLTNTFHLAIDIARIIKKRNRNSFIILGGPHVTFMYKEILEHDKKSENLIDFICLGEAEISMFKLVKILISQKQTNNKLKECENELKEINGLAFYDSKGKLNVNNKTNYIELEDLPLPARYKLSQDYYYYTIANIIVNRGCPNQCSFCSRQKLFKKTKIRSISSILSEIRAIQALQTYKYINFYDNININSSFLRDFCRMFIENKIDIPWGCEIRVDTITSEEARLLKSAGCMLIATGIESASIDVLSKNFKFQEPEKVKKGIANLKKTKIPIQAYFVLGLPGETEETFQKTINYIETLPLDENDTLNYFVATPYPGSRLWDEKDQFKINIIETNFIKYDCEHLIFETRELNQSKLENLFHKAKEIENKFNQK
ncbi:MAG: B12-binding domain-containing radical SAM protein [Promethearchaeota archaeon]|jgi:magnesium-protoporphyrin IX monomethyl ester (oxidative) cyclase